MNGKESAKVFIETTNSLLKNSNIVRTLSSSNASEDGGDAGEEGGGQGFAVEGFVFTILDYGFFVIMLLISGLIGVYYGFFSKRKQNNPAEYILGNKEMKVLPVAASLIVSQIAGVTMLAVPADVYANGSQYIMSFVSITLVGLSLIYYYWDYDLGFPSIFTYLEKRFDNRVKLTASLVFTLDCILSTPIVIYVPALAFNQVSGINVHLITVSTCILCIFYTTLGGLRGVVWTDTIQFVAIIGSVTTVIIVGIIHQGGFANIFEASERGGRLIFFNMDPNPLEKSTFWTISIGLGMMWMSQKCVSQGTIQRFLSLPSKDKAKRCVWLYVIGVSSIKIASCFIGLLIYARYEKCDPLTSGQIKKLDQILPLYAMDISRNLPGLAGIFIAGIFAAALSTMSTILNALAGTIFEDIIKPFCTDLGEKATSNVMKGIVVCLGVLITALVFVVEKLGTILQLAYSLHGLTAGSMIGIFTMGMLSPKINTAGIISGAISSLLLVSGLFLGTQSYPKPVTLPLNSDECISPTLQRNNTEIWLRQKFAYEEVPWIFRLSFMYYSLIGFIIIASVSYVISIATGGTGQKIVDEKLLAPVVRTKFSNDKVKYKVVQNIIPKESK